MTGPARPLAGGILAMAALAACAAPTQLHANPAPALIESIDGTDLHRITLTESAAERLAIRTDVTQRATVAGATDEQLAIPYSALLYTSDGAAWVYTSPEPLVFVRELVIVHEIVDGIAVLAAGEPDMTVVIVGAAELYGAETGLGASAH